MVEMTGPLRVLLHGASGRMGRAIDAVLAELQATGEGAPEVVARYGRSADAASGIAPIAELGDAPAFDVALDFSRPEAVGALVALCEQRGAAIVTGTTGLGADELARLDAASAKVPVLVAANFAIGVAVLEALVERAARALPDWDLDIVELHHRGKQDAPSGTALQLGAAADRGHATASSSARPVRYASLRSGDIVGEHAVLLAGSGERLELLHRATDRAIFARGALVAAQRLARRDPGRYRLADLLLES